MNFLQVAGLYPQFALNWPPSVLQLFETLSLANLNIEIARPECSVNAQVCGVLSLSHIQLSYFFFFTFKALLPLLLAFICAVILVVLKIHDAIVSRCHASSVETDSRTDKWFLGQSLVSHIVSTNTHGP